MNLLQRGAAFLNRVRQEALSLIVFYNEEPTAATVGKTVFKIDSGYGITYVDSTDFIISVSTPVDEPRKGDKIEWAETVYEVLAPDNEPVWRYSDSFKTAYRIHTKKVS